MTGTRNTTSPTGQPRGVNRWQSSGGVPIGNAGTPGATDEQYASPLLPTLSPGRVVTFSVGMIPLPGASLAINPDDVCFFPVAKWTRTELGQCAVLGARVDAFSGYASASATQTRELISDARIAALYGRAYSAGSLYPFCSLFGRGAAIIVASGQEYAKRNKGEWFTDDGFDPLFDCGAPVGGLAPNRLAPTKAPEHRFTFALPQGSIGDIAGSSVGRIERNSREQPFAARITDSDALVVMVAIHARYVLAARTLAAGAPGFFPFVSNGEILLATATEGRAW